MEIFTIENLTFSYPNQTPTLADISLKIERGAFVLVCGRTGCGKTTLLRHLKPALVPHGEKRGAIYFGGEPLADHCEKIGFVMQSAESQIVTDKVWHELAFGLENLGLDTAAIRLRVAEMANYFGIQTWFHKPVSELSGGQKQILALASVMVMQPAALILDEPASQLEPIAAAEFFSILARINRELGVTVIISEHRLEEALPLASQVIIMEKGRIIADGTPQESVLVGQSFMPPPVQIWARSGRRGACPLTVREGAAWLSTQTVKMEEIPIRQHTQGECALSVTDLWFRYEKNAPDVIKGLSLKGYYGEILAIVGGNATGKTTALSLIAGSNKPYRGKIKADTQIYALPQNPKAIFTEKSVGEELHATLSFMEITGEEKRRHLANVVNICGLESLLDRHPYDLSGGEQQQTALAKLLLLRPRILLLDEPTKGLDAEYKRTLGKILRGLTAELSGASTAIILVSHDIEFCAEYADRCALFFDGGIVTENTAQRFFCGNNFYTTSANRMARHVLGNAVTVGDVVWGLGGDVGTTSPPTSPLQPHEPQNPVDSSVSKEIKHGFSRITRILSGLSDFRDSRNEPIRKIRENPLNPCEALESLESDFRGSRNEPIRKIRENPLNPREALESLKSDFRGSHNEPIRRIRENPLNPCLIFMLTIPITISLGIHLALHFNLISTLIIFQALLPFALAFEGRKPKARELVIVAVFCAIAVAARSAFFMYPQFKPAIAIVIIAGVALGGEAGLLVGAMTAFVSNMFFGQGPWTPWQMLAFGVIGLSAGLVGRWRAFRRSVPLAIFGGIVTFFIYGGIMNFANVIMYQPSPTAEMFIASYAVGLPFDIVHSAATVIFLIITSRPLLDKVERVHVKYGGGIAPFSPRGIAPFHRMTVVGMSSRSLDSV
ncbi:MAG: ATP-binding cassette domain-containing protein [Defluviitaleaceae bacterium]|nr:ATP-binding cassette domain-containing protein [Defluviitaleaceae bacterium]